jgi:hypothetical protein
MGTYAASDGKVINTPNIKVIKAPSSTSPQKRSNLRTFTRSWQTADFQVDFDKQENYELLSAHELVGMQLCHQGLDYALDMQIFHRAPYQFHSRLKVL